MHRIVAQQMRIRLDRTEIVDRHDLQILAAAFMQGAKHQTADAAETVDCHTSSHLFLQTRTDRVRLLDTGFRRCYNRFRGNAEMLVQLGCRGGGAETGHADKATLLAQITFPAEADGRFHGDARAVA